MSTLEELQAIKGALVTAVGTLNKAHTEIVSKITELEGMIGNQITPEMTTLIGEIKDIAVGVGGVADNMDAIVPDVPPEPPPVP